MSADPAVATARFAWEEGLERMSVPVPPPLARARRSIVEAVHDELRRRLGLTFRLRDLAGVYDGAPAWYLDLAARTAPKTPDAWEPAVTLDAAFAIYSRQASDARR